MERSEGDNWKESEEEEEEDRRKRKKKKNGRRKGRRGSPPSPYAGTCMGRGGEGEERLHASPLALLRDKIFRHEEITEEREITKKRLQGERRKFEREKEITEERESKRKRKICLSSSQRNCFPSRERERASPRNRVVFPCKRGRDEKKKGKREEEMEKKERRSTTILVKEIFIAGERGWCATTENSIAREINLAEMWRGG